MSQKNVEVVRAIHEALARGESPATLGLLHPDIEYVNPPGAVEPGTRRGIAAYEDAVRTIDEAFEGLGEGNDAVVVCLRSAHHSPALPISRRSPPRTPRRAG